MTEKILGYLLLISGILIIGVSLFGAYSVFRGKMSVYPLFKLPGISIDLSSFISSDLPNEQKEILNKSQSLKTELISPQLINEPLNFIFHLLFMGFIANVGFKISSLGINLLRPIKVKLNEEKSQV